MKQGQTARYSVHELAEMSGVTVRTLHYYDQIGLLKPSREKNQYRSYHQAEVDRLQQILLYRDSGMELSTIKEILDNPGFDEVAAMKEHLSALEKKRVQLDTIIANVKKTIQHKTKEIPMENEEKFEGFKQRLIDENEEKYGKEIREKYGDEEVDASNAKLMGLSEEQYKLSQEIDQKMKAALLKAIDDEDPSGDAAQEACDLHRQWLGFFWKEGKYNKQAHLGLGQMYVSDDRFKAYYDEIAPGAAEFLLEALTVYCAE